MKKISLFISIFAMSIFMVACGTTNNTNKGNHTINDKNNTSNTVEENTGTNGTRGANNNNTGTNTDRETNAVSDDEIAKMDALDYEEFSLDIDYGNNKKYEVELDKEENNVVEAKIEDDINGVNKRGSEAFNELYPLVEKLTIMKDTSKDEAILEVLDVFKQDANYQKFDLEITFKDGTKIEFEDRK